MSDGDKSRIQGEYGERFVETIFAAAGFPTGSLRPDPGYDLVVLRNGVLFQVQVKTTGEIDPGSADLNFDLEVETYNRLILATASPGFLVVVPVPSVQSDWIQHKEDCVSMYFRPRWLCIIGDDATSNTETKRVHLPEAHVLTLTTAAQALDEAEGA